MVTLKSIGKKSRFKATNNLVNVNQILKSGKFEYSDKGFKYFIGNEDDNITRPLCIILPQMSGYIKYFENREKYVFYD